MTPQRPARPWILSCALPRRMLAGALLGLGALVVAAPPAHADTLTLKDGRIVEGIVSPTETGYWVLSRFGVTEVAKADVTQHTKTQGVDQQIRERAAKIPVTDLKNRAALATWLNGLGRSAESQEIAASILQQDPEHAGAHALLGHVRYKGRWMAPDAAKRAAGLERHGERWYTPEEWRALDAAAQRQANEAEARAQARERAEEVASLLRLATSPDAAVRARARSRLERMGELPNGKRPADLLPALDQYVEAIDEARTKAMSDGGMTGKVFGTFRVTLARLKRPIENFTTNLAAGPIGANAPVTLQLPELEVIKVRTTGIIPVVGP